MKTPIYERTPTMDKIAIAKQAASWIVGAGTAKIVSSIIQNNVDPEKLYQKIEVLAAGIVIGSMAKDATKAYTDTKIDGYVAKWHEFKSKKDTPTEETV